MIRSLAIAIALSACTSWTKLDRAALAGAGAALACDWAQTRSAASRRWVGDGVFLSEANPVLGPYPSAARVDAYFGLSAAAVVAVWAALPPGLRALWGGSATAVQAGSVRRNVGSTGTVCGIR